MPDPHDIPASALERLVDVVALPIIGHTDGLLPVSAEPTGHIHWAGAETAGEHAGYIEGAIESGVRVAGEVSAALGGDAALPRH